MIKMIKQSGIVPYRIRKGKLEVLLITSSNRKRWIIPKGWVEPCMSAAASAAKEAYEEAGVLGSVRTPAIGTYQRQKWGMPCSVEVFLMRVETVLDDWAEANQRQRQWLSVAKAIKRVEDAGLKQLLQQCEQFCLN